MMGNISNISLALYKSLGLPAPKSGQKLRADHNALTKKIDGNTDSNLDGEIDEKDKNGLVETEELYEEVFNDRKEYHPVIKKLYEAGLEDPFEERPEIKTYVDKLFEKHGPFTSIQKAIVLFRAVLPPGVKFIDEICSIISPSRLITVDQIHIGFTIEQGGLTINYNRDFRAPLREKFGNPLPKELLNAPAELRVSKCNGSDNLLISLLRAAGKEAYIKGDYKNELSHAYVIAILEDRSYRLDPAKLIFRRTCEKADSDREGISFHYLREAYIRSHQRKYSEAARAYEFAFEINPKVANVRYWHNYGLVLARLGKRDKAAKAFKRAKALKNSNS